MTLRETSKERRREAILAAAHELLSAPGEQQFSMRKLAEHAGVSIATPYNLFGSKHAIVAALSNTGSERFGEMLDNLEGDALTALLKAPHFIRVSYAQQPDFHRNFTLAAYQNSSPEMRATVGTAPVQIWMKLLERAQQSNDLITDIDAGAFAVTYGELMLAHILVWAQGFITLDEMEARMAFGAALILSGVATETGRARLTPIRKETETALQSAWAGAAENTIETKQSA
jgi:AcrR family transcriptional regulator